MAGVENGSDGSDGDGLPCQDSIRLSVSLFARVATGVENVGKRTPSDPMETGCHVKSPLDSPQVCQESIGLTVSQFARDLVNTCCGLNLSLV